MAIQVETRRWRAEDLVGDLEKFTEIVEGHLIQMSPHNAVHQAIALNISLIFSRFCALHPQLRCLGDCGFLLQREPDTLLAPDVSLFTNPDDFGVTAFLRFAPELAVEILSPSNNKLEMTYKRSLYFRYGAEQVWEVDPKMRSITFHYADGRSVTVMGDEVVDGEGIAEGMSIDLREVFRNIG